MKRPALQKKQVVILRMAFRARKVLGTFEKRAPEVHNSEVSMSVIFWPISLRYHLNLEQKSRLMMANHILAR